MRVQASDPECSGFRPAIQNAAGSGTKDLRELILARIAHTVRLAEAAGDDSLLADLEHKSDAELLAWHERIQVLADRTWRLDDPA